MSLTVSWESLTTSWARKTGCDLGSYTKREEITLERENRDPEIGAVD